MFRLQREAFLKEKEDFRRLQEKASASHITKLVPSESKSTKDVEHDLPDISTGYYGCINSFIPHTNNFSGHASRGDQHFLLGRFVRQLIHQFDIQKTEGLHVKELIPPMRFMRYFLSNAKVQTKEPLVKMVDGNSCTT